MNNKLVRGKPFQTGESGNPHGRPKGSRNAFSVAFIGDLTASWAQHGPDVLRKVAVNDPSRFLGVCASVLPKDVALSIEQNNPGNLDPADWAIVMEVMSAVKQALPDANARPAGSVLEFTLDAIRAHSAKLVDSQDGDTDCTEKPR